MMQYFKSDDFSWANNLPKEEWIKFVETQKGPTEKWQDYWTIAAREKVHNLDLSNPEHKKIYDETLRTHIMFGELTWQNEDVKSAGFDFVNSNNGYFQVPKEPNINTKVYPDNKGLNTIGIGFNMESTGAKAEWVAALCQGEKKLTEEQALKLFADVQVKNTEKKITQEQALKLFDHSIKIREKELRKKFGKDWDLLKPNEQITLMSLYYNSGKLIGPDITADIKQYVQTKDEKYLRQAFDEVKYRSNPKVDSNGKSKEVNTQIAVQIRMDREAGMLKSYDCPKYSKPGESSNPNNSPIKIKLGKTVIPSDSKLNIDRESRGRQYYIWRTQNDSKVRLNHSFFEGKIFHVDQPPAIGHPGTEKHCRCFHDYNVPDFIEIKYYSGEIVKKHITDLYEISGFCIK